MKLELMINGEKKIFVAPFVSGMHFRKLLEYDETLDYTDMGVEEYDEIAGFVRNLFGDQFTVNELFEGIPSHKLTVTFVDVFGYVRTGKDPKNREMKDEMEEGNDQGK